MMELISRHHTTIYMVFEEINKVCVMACEIDNNMAVLSKEGKYEHIHNDQSYHVHVDSSNWKIPMMYQSKI